MVHPSAPLHWLMTPKVLGVLPWAWCGPVLVGGAALETDGQARASHGSNSLP